MTSLKPPLNVTRSRECRVLKNREHEQRLISQLTIKRNSVLLQLRAAQLAGKDDDNLEETRRSLEHLARELDRHLAAAGQEELPIPPNTTIGRRQKRPAPVPPAMTSLSNAISAPDLARGAPSPVSDTRSRRRLKKSLSLSGSRSFFATMLATLRVGRSRVPPALYRRSRSQDSLNLAPLDIDQKLVNDTAVRAQQRRGSKSHNRSHSADPRQFLSNMRSHNDSSPQSHKRPDHLFLPTHKHRYTPRERSPLTMRPLTPHELYIKTPTPDQEPYFVQGVSEAALHEIAAFEKLIMQFVSRNKLPATMPGPGY